jgi:hypothetical protein
MNYIERLPECLIHYISDFLYIPCYTVSSKEYQSLQELCPTLYYYLQIYRKPLFPKPQYSICSSSTKHITLYFDTICISNLYQDPLLKSVNEYIPLIFENLLLLFEDINKKQIIHSKNHKQKNRKNRTISNDIHTYTLHFPDTFKPIMMNHKDNNPFLHYIKRILSYRHFKFSHFCCGGHGIFAKRLI